MGRLYSTSGKSIGGCNKDTYSMSLFSETFQALWSGKYRLNAVRLEGG